MIGRGSPILIEHAAAARGRDIDEPTQAAMLERFFHLYGELEESKMKTNARPVSERRRRPAGGARRRTLRTAVVLGKQHRFADAFASSA